MMSGRREVHDLHYLLRDGMFGSLVVLLHGARCLVFILNTRKVRFHFFLYLCAKLRHRKFYFQIIKALKINCLDT